MTMCLDAAGMGGIGFLTSAIGSFAGYQSSMLKADFERKMAERQAQVYEQQANIARQNAVINDKQSEIAMDKGADEVNQVKQKYRTLTGQQRAVMGALGFVTTDGSPDKILDETEELANIDIEAMRYNNRKTKWGYDIGRMNYLNEAIMLDSSAANARWGGDATYALESYSARNTLLTGITGAATDYYGKFGGSTSGKGSSSSSSSLKINPDYNRQTGWIGPKQRILMSVPTFSRG